MKAGWRRCAGKMMAGFAIAAILFSSDVVSVSASNVPSVSKKLVLTEGETGNIKVSGKYISSTVFQSGNSKIAVVGKKGKVTAKKAGNCNIKITVKYKKRKSAKKVSKKSFRCAVEVTRDISKKPESTYVPEPQVTQADPFVMHNAEFSVKLLQNSAADALAKGENVLISPESVLCALAMTANGAAGETLSELQSVLCGDTTLDEFNLNMSEYNQRLVNSDKVKFRIADSIWVRDDVNRIQIKENFLEVNKRYYDAEAFLAAFDDTTVQDINDWVKNNTNEMIPQLVDEIPERAVAYLINAIAFEGNWQKQYSAHDVEENQEFVNAKGVTEKVTMLNGVEHWYISDKNTTGFIKSYEGDKYAFMAILPKQGVSISEYLKQMSGEKLIALYQNKTNDKVYTKMPEFSYDFSTNLKEPLKAMGIQKAFLPSADFSNMLEWNLDNLYISDVLHKTHIELDRYGTKAAAVTAVIAEVASAFIKEPKQVSLTRPFLYAIIDTETGTPIFIGVVNTVTN